MIFIFEGSGLPITELAPLRGSLLLFLDPLWWVAPGMMRNRQQLLLFPSWWNGIPDDLDKGELKLVSFVENNYGQQMQ